MRLWHSYRVMQEVVRSCPAGVNSAELWNNLGLCCFHASQYDMALGCFERAFRLADDASMADVWYNIGQVALGEGLCGGCMQTWL